MIVQNLQLIFIDRPFLARHVLIHEVRFYHVILIELTYVRNL